MKKPSFKWQPGMLDVDGFRLIKVTLHDGSFVACRESPYEMRKFYHPTHPDVNDPATEGCLFRQLLDFEPTGKINVAWVDSKECFAAFVFGSTHGCDLGTGATRGEAILNALEWISKTADNS